MALESQDFRTTYHKENGNNNPKKSSRLMSEEILHNFTEKIQECFPNYAGSIICDYNGYLVHSEIKNSLDENLLALTCIAEDRNFMDLSNYQKLIRPLSNKIKMLVLLKKSWKNQFGMKNFNEIVERENPI